MINEVEVPKAVEKQIEKLPDHIQDKFMAWVGAIEETSLEEVRKSPGMHDEPVKGSKGQRSVRMSKSYRAYYRIHSKDEGKIKIEFVRVEGVDKHKYGK